MQKEEGADNISDVTSVLSKWKAARPQGGANIFQLVDRVAAD